MSATIDWFRRSHVQIVTADTFSDEVTDAVDIGRGGQSLVGAAHALIPCQVEKVVWKGQTVVYKSYFRPQAEEAVLLVKWGQHPNVLSCHAVVVNADEDVVGIVLDYAPGGTLNDLMQQQRSSLTLKTAIHILKTLSGVLSDLSERGMVHRDLKPENVFIGPNGVLQLGDFGSMKNAKSIATAAAGTPLYLAPEAYKSQYDHKADVWSLGMIIFELLSGEAPFALLVSDPNPRQALRELVLTGKRPTDFCNLVVAGEGGKKLIAIMEECWLANPVDRPSAASIHSWLCELDKETSVDEALPGKRKGKREELVLCRYDGRCYQVNPSHWARYRHVKQSGALPKIK